MVRSLRWVNNNLSVRGLPMDLKMRSFLIATALEVGDIACRAQSSAFVVKDTGGGGGITTQADLDIQAMITERIQTEYPGVPIVGEEGNSYTVCPASAFIVDPIDGSAPYEANSPDWSTTIAYRSPTLSQGVIYFPRHDRLYSTGPGQTECWTAQGSYPHPLPVQGAESKKPQWRICCPIAGEFSDEVLEMVFLPLVRDRRIRAVENLSCNTAHFMRLFEGWDDAVIMWAKTWDSAAAIPMAKMLGITVKDFQGNEPDLSVIAPQRLIFARGPEVLQCILEHTKYWPLRGRELRKASD